MNNENLKVSLFPRGNGGGFLRFIIPMLLVVLLLQACSLLPSTVNTMPGVNSTQAILSASSPASPTEPAKKPALESVHPPSVTPSPVPTLTPTLFPSPTPTLAATNSPTRTPVVFGVIGDYGMANQGEADVAKLVLSWKPDFIISLGDNNYPSGATNMMDKAVGQDYHSYIYPYNGTYGAGADVNRFFPALGNHDVLTDNGKPYYDYFTLPGNERYYDFVWGPVHFFVLDNLDGEPDGVNATSVQAMWLKQKLAESNSAWNIIYMHYPPYSSGTHGSTTWARWPYKEWGADAVLSGHDHSYERLQVDGLAYFVNGLGGAGIYNFKTTLDGSQVRFNSDLGAMRVEATDTHLKFEFITRKGEIIDTYEISK